MGLTSLQVCMDSSEWFQGTLQEEIAAGMDSSSSPSGMSDPMLAAACSRPLMERRLRPQQDQALKCPRCDSTHTKFCYYNNYSLTQPRYFCKTCRRYWTKGGTLRNIPVGGGCRKNKKVSSNSKKPTSACTPINHNHNNSHVSNDNLNHNNNINNFIQHHPNFMNPNNHHLIMNSTDLQLSYPDHQSNLFGIGNSSFMFENLSNGVASRAIEFMEGGGGGGGGGGYGGYTAEMGGGNLNILGQNYLGGNLCSPFGGMTLDSMNNPFMERSGLINAYSNNQDQGRINVNVNVHADHGISSSLDVKPKLLALEWQDQSCSSDHHGGGGGSSGGGGYLTGLGSSWGGIVNGYGTSTSNPLV